MKRIATTIAIAALAVGATATTASARPAPPEGGAADDSTLAWVQYQHQGAIPAKKPTKKTAKPKKKTHDSTWIIYPGHD